MIAQPCSLGDKLGPFGFPRLGWILEMPFPDGRQWELDIDAIDLGHIEHGTGKDAAQWAVTWFGNARAIGLLAHFEIALAVSALFARHIAIGIVRAIRIHLAGRWK